MGELVFKHHGIVDKYLGDGFLAVFGAPVSGAARRRTTPCGRPRDAALPGRREPAVEPRAGADAIDMGISIHTGEVVAGNIGFEKKMDYTVIGDAGEHRLPAAGPCQGASRTEF
ncbi:MAG: adenylate/guanylate cyclase domain-containing protein [Desulfobacterales bacterium]|nr:adenylate/guanylate cyclase domain-containing protein [Desulfobacterales bacterium]